MQILQNSFDIEKMEERDKKLLRQMFGDSVLQAPAPQEQDSLLNIVQGIGIGDEEGDENLFVDLSKNDQMSSYLNKYIQERKSVY